jgi:hypothetical protein
MEEENVPKRGIGLGGVISIIIIVIIVLTGIAIAAIYLYNSKYKNKSSDESAESTTVTPVLEDETTWTVYTKAGDYSVKVPPILISPGNQTELMETNSFSRSGDPGVGENGNEPATLDPDLYSTIWSAQNTQNLTAKQAVEEEKANIISFPTNSLQTTKENAVTINNNAGYQGVWSYTDQNTQLSHVYAVAATVKSGKVYYISLTISSKTSAGALQGWNQYSYLFDKMISAFIFL